MNERSLANGFFMAVAFAVWLIVVVAIVVVTSHFIIKFW